MVCKVSQNFQMIHLYMRLSGRMNSFQLKIIFTKIVHELRFHINKFIRVYKFIEGLEWWYICHPSFCVLEKFKNMLQLMEFFYSSAVLTCFL